MAAYAALVSLVNVLTRIQHPSCPVSYDHSQIKSLSEKITSLVNFLESYSQRISNDFEKKMASVAFALEDAIETYYVDRIAGPATAGSIEDVYSRYCEDLEKAVQETDVIIQGAAEVTGMNVVQEEKVPVKYVGGGEHKMVGFDEDVLRLMEQLTIDQPRKQILPVVGMGGIGKTTLVRNVYVKPYVVHYFHVRAWVTLSQVCTVGTIIRPLLKDLDVDYWDEESDENLGELLYKYLYGRKYLIVLDDIWTSTAWYEIMRFFPDNSNGSRILITTRLLDLALSVGSCTPYEVKLLDDNQSWDLLSETVFGRDACPRELEKLGKDIAGSCKGLPLAIVVISGLLRMSEKTKEYWVDVAKNVSSTISTDGGHCLEILSLSYTDLPIHLKPCFLYMATFREDQDIHVRMLIQLWSIEGFLRPIQNRTLEEAALEYLNDLIARNLVLVKSRGSNGDIKICVLHDLVRELCLIKAQDGGFISIIDDRVHILQKLGSGRRLLYQLPNDVEAYLPSICMPPARSLVCCSNPPQFTSGCRLLRVLLSNMLDRDDDDDEEEEVDVMHLVNLRLLNSPDVDSRLLSSICLLWNLESIFLGGCRGEFIPAGIWELPNLRHLQFHKRLVLSDPTSGAGVLNNLQTIHSLLDFNCTEEVVCRIPTLKLLRVVYSKDFISRLEYPGMTRCFSNLGRLDKLESLKIIFDYEVRKCLCLFDNPENLTFSPSLRRLHLASSNIPWKNMTMIGSLPNLEVLKLEGNAFSGSEWNSAEGEFQSLKSLTIEHCHLRTWRAESSHFPRLQRLKLEFLELEEVPLSISEIAALETIELMTLKKSAVISAKEIVIERENLGDDDLLIRVCYCTLKNVEEDDKKELEDLATDKFQVEFEIITPARLW